MDMKVVDFRKVEKSRLILVVEDVYETRAGIDTLLKANGYRVAFARAEGEAINSTRPERPDLILVSGGGVTKQRSRQGGSHAKGGRRW